MSRPTSLFAQPWALFQRRTALLGALALLLVAAYVVRPGVASADSLPDFRVIVHAENPSTLSRDFLADIYLKRVTRWPDGEDVHPVDQRPSSAVRQHFSDSILKRSVAAMKRYWQQRIFSGRELPPPELDSDEAVVSYVVGHRGAVGYVSGGAKLDRAKAVVVH